MENQRNVSLEKKTDEKLARERLFSASMRVRTSTPWTTLPKFAVFCCTIAIVSLVSSDASPHQLESETSPPSFPSAEHSHDEECARHLSKHTWPGAKHRYVHCEVEDVHCFVKQALRMWNGRNISRENVERAWRGRSEFGEYCCLVQILDGKLTLLHPPERNLSSVEEGWRQDLYSKRIDAFVEITQKAMAFRGAIPDLEFTFCLSDCISTLNRLIPEFPEEDDLDASFTVVQCLGSTNIPLPLFDVYRPPNDVSLDDWPLVVQDIKRNRDGHPWETRATKVAFRGGARSCHACATPEGFHLPPRMTPRTILSRDNSHCGRPLALAIARDDPLLDFAEGGKLDMPGHEAYKYVVYLHGHCHWANRLRRLLFMGMALFKQEGICEEFYGMRLRPWVHYIPVDYNLRNLTDAVRWALSNDDEVRDMIRQRQEYAEAFDTSSFAIEYAYHLLHRYAGMMDYKVQPREGGEAR